MRPIRAISRPNLALSVLCLTALLSTALAPASVASEAPADVVFRNGAVYTADVFGRRARAVAIRGGKLVAVGSDDEIATFVGDETRVHNLRGKMLMPGLIDTHIHPVRGALTALGLAFPVESSVDEITAAVERFIAEKKLAPGEWVEGAKWSIDYKKLTAAMLDADAPDNPVFLHDWTNHLAWVNSAALKAAGITKDTPDPEGGVIDRDASGNPTGTLHDKALGLIVAAMPPPKPELVEERAAWIFGRLNRYGITGIVTAQLDSTRAGAYRALESKEKLTLRIQGSWDFNTRYVTGSLEDQAATFLSPEKRGKSSELLNFDGVKIYMDGVPNDAHGGSPMIDSYATAQTFGTPSIDEATFSTWMLRFDTAGLKVMAHATGSLSVRHFLNAVEATRRANGKGPIHHMAHSMLVYPEEIPRFEFDRSGFVTEISPYQLWVPDPTANSTWPRLIGLDRFDQTFTPIKSLVNAGAVVTYGSDWDNVPQPDPWLALEGMVTRRYPGEEQYGRLNPDQRVDVETAIRIFTRNGAVAMGLEDQTGTLEVGKSADLIVIDRDILKVPVDEIHETRVLRTMLRGKTVYER